MSRRELLVLSLYQMLANNRGGLFLVFFPLYLIRADGASPAIALSLVSAGYVAASLLGPLTGRWSDRIGRRRPFLLAAEIGSLPLFASIPFVSSYVAAGALFIAAQIVLSIGTPALNAFVSDVTREQERAEGYGWLNSAGNVGSIAGFIATGLLSLWFGLGAFIPFVVAVMVGTTLIVVFFVPDLRTAPAPARRPWSEFRELTVFSFTVSIRSLGAGAVGAFYGTFAAMMGATSLDISVIAVTSLAAGALVAIPAGRLIDRRGEIRGILWGTILSVAGIGLYFVATSWPVLIPGQIFRVLGITFLSPAMLAWVSHMAPAGHRAEFLGFFSLINSTLWSLGPLCGGIALAFGGNFALLTFALVTTLVSIVAVEGLYLRSPGRGRPVVPSAPAA